MEHLVWNVDPVFLNIMGFKIYWYGVFFASAILLGLQVLKWTFVAENKNVNNLDPILTYAVIGVIVGARLAHCLFYEPGFYLSNPLKILAIWEGGLASHGGGLGLLIGMVFYSRKYQIPFLWLVDRLTLSTAVFAIIVRLANFINAEIVGIPTSVSWGIIFSKIDNLPRHPAQLYEALAYLVIFLVLLLTYIRTKKSPAPALLTGLFLTLTFTARLLIESVKTKQAAYSTDLALNTGQLLSIPFICVGLGLLVWSFITRNKNHNGQ